MKKTYYFHMDGESLVLYEKTWFLNSNVCVIELKNCFHLNYHRLTLRTKFHTILPNQT